MNKNNRIAHVADAAGLTKGDAARFVDAVSWQNFPMQRRTR